MDALKSVVKVQPRYAAYCALNGGLSPEITMRRDQEKYPGGVMAGFILWVNEMWREWEETFGKVEVKGQEHHDHFDAWLQDKVKNKPKDLIDQFKDAGRLQIISIK